jgi:hypothetical protein
VRSYGRCGPTTSIRAATTSAPDREGEALFGGIYIIAAIVGIAALVWVSELGAYLGWRLSREHGLRDGQVRGIWRLAPPVGALVLVALLVMTLASAFGP